MTRGSGEFAGCSVVGRGSGLLPADPGAPLANPIAEDPS